MTDPRFGSHAALAGLVIDAVETLPSDLGTLLVRVAGHWRRPPPQEVTTAVLVVREGRREYRLAALPETSEAASRAAREERPFRAAFSVPRELESGLAGVLTLDLGVGTMELSGLRAPPPSPDQPAAAPREATVIDRAVLAERRARRAELAEESAARRAHDADQALRTLEGELAKLELRLGGASDERAELERQLDAQRRQVRTADQRAHAEAQRREEAQHEGVERVKRSEAIAAALRARLRGSDARVRELAQELEEVQRRAAEAQQSIAAAQAKQRRAERERASAHEAKTAEDELSRARASAEQARLEVDTLRRELDLARRRGQRTAATPPSAPAAPGPLDPALLERERRTAATVAEQRVDEARAAVAEVTFRLDQERHERALAEQDLQQRWEHAYADLGARLAGLEQQAAQLQAALDAERAARAAAEAELHAERERGGQASEHAARLEHELHERAAAQERLQHSLDERRAELERIGGQLQQQVTLLDHERRQAEARAEGAELALEQRRQELEQRATSEAQLRDQLARERVAFEVEAKRIEQTVSTLHAQLATVQNEMQERARRAEATERIAAESIETSRSALDEAERRIAAAQETASELQRQLDYERAERELAESELRERLTRERDDVARRLATLEVELRAQTERADAERDAAARWAKACVRMQRELDARASAEPAPRPAPAPEPAPAAEESAPPPSPEPPPESAPGPEKEADETTDAETGQPPNVAAEYARYALGGTEPASPPDAPVEAPADAQAPPAPAQPHRRRSPRADTATETTRPWLARALPQLAYEDPFAAASLAIELLPAQALAVSGRLNYDLVIADVGCYHVSIDARRARVVKRRYPRSRIEVDFRIETDAAGLVELLVGGGSWRLRLRGVRVRATRRKSHALRALPPTPLRLAELARAAIWPDPGQLYRALAHLIDPAWTRGHRFTVELEISGSKGGTWYLVVDGGKRIAVTDVPPADGPTATVRTSQAIFQHLLDREPSPPQQKVLMKGDARSLALLTQWIEWAQGIAEPPGAAPPG